MPRSAGRFSKVEKVRSVTPRGVDRAQVLDSGLPVERDQRREHERAVLRIG